MPIEHEGSNDEELAYTLEEEKLSSFSSLLRSIIRRDRSEVVRLAKALEVSENTIYRWMNGSSEPRTDNLRRLLDALPEHHGNLTYVINQTFPGILTPPPTRIRDIQKDLYRRALDLAANTDDDDACFWQICQEVFEHALLHLDIDHKGLCITYIQLMPPASDGNIHSLREAVMRGSPPWPHNNEGRAFLGATTLVGYAAMTQRMHVWSVAERYSRLPVVIDEYEMSACAVPITRGNRIGGVLLISSTQVDFFNDPASCEAATEYARLLSIGLRDKVFEPGSKLRLRAMPSLKWQRDYISHSYKTSVLKYIGDYRVSQKDAEDQIQRDMERIFESKAQNDNGLSSSNSDHFQDIHHHF